MRFDVVDLLSKKEIIAGLDVSDSFLRLVLLNETRHSKLVFVEEAAEVPLAKGIIESGILKNEEAFLSAVSSLLSKSKAHIEDVIVSLSDLNAYSKIFSFPKAISGEKLNSAMRVSSGFNLPVNTDDVYLDWESVPSETSNEVYLALIPKKIVDPYIKAFEKIKVKPVIVETHILSIVRSIKTEGVLPTLIILKGRNSTSFMVVKGRSLRFARAIGRAMNNDELDTEIKKISDFYEVSDESIKKIITLDELEMPPKFKDDPKLIEASAENGTPKDKVNQRDWLVAVGAAMRGLLHRSEDQLITLTSIGTERAYEIQKDTIFAKFIYSATIAMSAVIAAAFIMVWFLMLTIQRNILPQRGAGTGALPQNSIVLENRAASFNAMVQAIQGIIKQSPNWSLLFDELRSRLTTGIIINSFQSNKTDEPIMITGTAKTRANLNEFEQSLKTSEMFTSVQIPLTDLEKKTDINFRASFKLKDPNSLYSKI